MRLITMSAIKRRQSEIALAGVLLSMGVAPATAQQPGCPVGSPCATAPISGEQLPPLPDKFEGTIERNMSGIGQGGTGVLKVDGTAVATQTMEHTLPLILQWDENFDIGADTGTPVDDQTTTQTERFS